MLDIGNLSKLLQKKAGYRAYMVPAFPFNDRWNSGCRLKGGLMSLVSAHLPQRRGDETREHDVQLLTVWCFADRSGECVC